MSDNVNLSNSFDDADKKLLDTFKNMYWWMVPEDFVIFDLETTGLTPRTDRILEIGAIAVNKKNFLETGAVDTFECFVKQDKPIPSEAQRINKISDEMVADGLSELDALAGFFKFCDGKFMLAYNSPFDVKFLNSTARRCKYPIEDEYLESVQDIYKLAKKYIKQDFVPDKRLGTIANAIGVKVEKSHRALVDALTAFYVYMFLKQLEFDHKHWDTIQSIKRMATVTGTDEKILINDLMITLYPPKS